MPSWIIAVSSVFVLANGASTSLDSRALSAGMKDRPVMKVVRLLKDMEVELRNELKDDEAVHEKLACWCETNEKEKTQAIEMGEAKVEQLTSSMGEAMAKIVELKARRKSTMADLDKDQAALGQARELRMKENKAFHGEETDLMEAIAACKQALIVLGKHNPELAQIRSIVVRLQETRVAQLALGAQKLPRDQLETLKGFLHKAASAPSFLATPGYQGYATQSGQIFGILKQMQEDFEDNLGAAQKAELKAQEEFEALKAAKKDQIASAKEVIVQLDGDLADLGETHAQAVKELENTKEELGLDRTFLAKLKKKCSESSEEYDARTKSRLEEISAVEETIKILNSDDAFDGFDKTVNAVFLQASVAAVQVGRVRRERAASLLRAAASRFGAPSLALLATSTQLDAFTKVQAAIDKLVSELKSQQQDEVAHRDWCVDEMNTNERTTAEADDKKETLEVTKADLEKAIEQLTAGISSDQSSISETEIQMTRASENREADSAEAHQTIMDQRLTQMILSKAMERMKQVYALVQQGEEPEQPGGPHVELSGTRTDPGNGPARFKNYAQNAGGSRVVAMIGDIIADSKRTESEAVESEEDAQAAYEDLMMDSNKSIKKHMESIASQSEEKAKTQSALAMTDADLKQTMKELEGLSEMLGDLRKSCDFLLKNFDARQEARAAEMESLSDAKAVLAGMK